MFTKYNNVPACAHGLGQHDSGGVNGLEESLAVDPPSDLLDKNGGQSLGAEFLVNA